MGVTDKSALYTSGSGTNTLLFNYTVSGTDGTLDLDYVNSSSLTLNGGVIQDAATNTANLILAVPGAVNSISDNQAIVIDTAGPFVATYSPQKQMGIIQQQK